MLAAVTWLTVGVVVHAQAESRRREMRYALVSYLTLVALHRAAGQAMGKSLELAALIAVQLGDPDPEQAHHRQQGDAGAHRRAADAHRPGPLPRPGQCGGQSCHHGHEHFLEAAHHRSPFRFLAEAVDEQPMWDIQPTNCIRAGYSRNTNVVKVRITFGMASRVDAAAAASSSLVCSSWRRDCARAINVL